MATETKELAKMDNARVMEQVVVGGDLSKLTPADRVNYYARVCSSIALNPLTKPFAYITLNGRLTLYATRDCADQLRRRDKVSLEVTVADMIGDLYVVRVRAKLPDGRTDEDSGAVNIAGLKGDALANATMKAITKAKRRATLSICGLGWLDETEIETIPDAQTVVVDMDTGEVQNTKAAETTTAKPTATAKPGNGNLGFEQLKSIKALRLQYYGNDQDGDIKYRDQLEANYRVRSSTQLTVPQANALQKFLQNKINAGEVYKPGGKRAEVDDGDESFLKEVQ
jgi:hypothetical protein